MRHFSGTHTFLSKYVRSTHGHVNAHETHLLNNNKIRTLLTLIKQLDAYGSNPAIIPIQEGVCNYISYAELAEKVAQLSSGLVQTGICSGDHVALLARNSDEWIIACLATIKAGAVVVLLDLQFTEKTLQRIIDANGIRCIFTTIDHIDRLKKYDAENKILKILLNVDAEDRRGWRHLQSNKSFNYPQAKVNDNVALLYTSGTRKAVPLTHGNIAFQLNNLLELKLLNDKDRILLPLPFHHVYSFVLGILTSLTLGLPIILPESLTGPKIIRAIKDGQATVLIGVPRLYSVIYSAIKSRLDIPKFITRNLMKLNFTISKQFYERLNWHFGKYLLPSVHKEIGPTLRLLACGGAPLEHKQANTLEALGWKFVIGYGLTETASLLAIKLPNEPHIDSVGKPLKGVDIRIDPIPQNSQKYKNLEYKSNFECVTGEILARGPCIFSGYKNHELRSNIFTESGWFRTGDLGCIDEDGFLHVYGGISTLIITDGGIAIEPEEIEEVYNEARYVKEIGVLQDTKQLVAVIVPDMKELHQQSELDIWLAIHDSILGYSRNLPSYQRLSKFTMSAEPLPRSTVGTIQRNLLAQRYRELQLHQYVHNKTLAQPMLPEEMSSEDRSLLNNHAANKVWHWLIKRYPYQRLTPDTNPLLDLGVDSLEWLSLTMEIHENIGLELNERAISHIDTIRELLKEVIATSRAGVLEPEPDPLEEPEKILSADQKYWLTPLSAVSSKTSSVVYQVANFLVRSGFHLRVVGHEHLYKNQQYIFAPNHVSYLDPFIIGIALGRHWLSNTYWAAWTGVAFKNTINRSFSRIARVFPVEAESVLSTLALGAEVIKMGHNLVWFPEGRRSLTGELQKFRGGIGILLEHFKIPVVPVYIHGTYDAWPPDKKWPKPKPVTVIFGPALNPRDLEREGKGNSTPERIANALHDHVEELGVNFHSSKASIHSA